ncbi:hypothetical protein [Allostreptomyces psammosilenae]|uniref:Uncharacterized protein n=1 Tax=Allostreptomyces psammosilenae TaxID=1892865 RepID=A0A852ZWW9_9ACTN|nr:hypothetical protein [Allostreptomyces psammosilenae]NYI06893.1 hypothetical protein [Allostreptomyces psammosilenae]
MDIAQAALLRELLDGSDWVRRTRDFAAELRAAARLAPAGAAGRPGTTGPLLVGTPSIEPWHFAAHLRDEAAWSGLDELRPTLVRWRVPPGAPPHLAVSIERLESVRRSETVLVAAPGPAPVPLLERVADARRAGAVILALEDGDQELRGLAHHALTVPGGDPGDEPGGDFRPPGRNAEPAPGGFPFELTEHLVCAAAGEVPSLDAPGPGGRRRIFRDRLARIADALISPPPARW